MRSAGVDHVRRDDRPLLDPESCIHRQPGCQIDDFRAFDRAQRIPGVEQVRPMKLVAAVHRPRISAHQPDVGGEVALEIDGQFVPDLSGGAENCLHPALLLRAQRAASPGIESGNTLHNL
jgi:hypothetical protein